MLTATRGQKLDHGVLAVGHSTVSLFAGCQSCPKSTFFVSSMGNFIIIILDHTKKKKYDPIVRNIGHLDSSIDLAGLGRHGSRQQQASEDRFVFPVGHGVIVLASGLQGQCLPLAEKARRGSGDIAPSCTQCGAHCPYSGTIIFFRCQVSRPHQGWTLPVWSCKGSVEGVVAGSVFGCGRPAEVNIRDSCTSRNTSRVALPRHQRDGSRALFADRAPRVDRQNNAPVPTFESGADAKTPGCLISCKRRNT